MLKTKLYRPPLTREHVYRTRLIKRFEQNFYKPLSLVCAPAGYGKSMLLSSWLENYNGKYVWISLTENDNDLKVFLTCLQLAIKNIFPKSLSDLTNLLQIIEQPPTDLLIDTLINELDQIKEDFVVVFDDYHYIHDKDIHRILDTLLQFPPEHIHVVISTRNDPPLMINKLRLHERINELRMRELGFNLEEVVSLFQKSHSVTLEEATAISLVEKTEGWITSLRLTSLTFNDWKDSKRLLDDFTGDVLSLTEYLFEEVIKKQTSVLRNLIIKISILDRFCDELLDVILQSEGLPNNKALNGNEIINLLLKSDLFLIKLDRESKWFRFHHQFQHMLQKQLKQKFTVKEIHKLHLDVSDWLMKNEYMEEAIHHALEVENYEMATRVLINNRKNIVEKGLWYALEICLNKFPEQTIDASPELLIIQTWIYIHHLNYPGIVSNIEKIEKLAKKIPIDSIEGELYFFKGYYSMLTYRNTEAEKLLKKAIDKIPKELSHSVGEAEIHYALALQFNNKKKEALRFIENRINNQTTNSNIRVSRFYIGLALMHLFDANLYMAIDPAVKCKEISYENNFVYTEGWGKYSESLVMFNQGKFMQAEKLFSDLTQKTAGLHTRMVADCFATMLLHLQISGQQKALVEMIAKFRQFSSIINNDWIRVVLHSAQSRLALLQGDIDSAIQFIRMVDISADIGIMSVFVEIPRITFCRVLIAEGTNDTLNEAIIKLSGYYDDNDQVCNTCQKIGIKLLLAVAYHKLGEKTMAIENLTACVELGSLGGWIFPFIEYGETIMELLPLVLSSSKNNTRYIKNILQTLEKNSGFRKTAPIIKDDKKAASITENLSKRENEILLLVSKGMRNKEIAHKLFVSEGTIKKHLYNMGQKFNTSSRVDLLNKARTLELIE